MNQSGEIGFEVDVGGLKSSLFFLGGLISEKSLRSTWAQQGDHSGWVSVGMEMINIESSRGLLTLLWCVWHSFVYELSHMSLHMTDGQISGKRRQISC